MRPSASSGVAAFHGAVGRLLDPWSHEDALDGLIARHGDMSEHSKALLACHDRPEAPARLYVPESGDGGALLQVGADAWNVTAEPLAPRPDRPAFLIAIARDAFARGARALTFEGREDFIDAVRASAPAGWAIEEVRPYYWPVFDLATWNSAMPGGEHRDVRNKLNRFQREHSWRIVPAPTVDRQALTALLDRWISARDRPEGVERSYYATGIANGFRWFDESRVVMIGDVPAALTAGWRIPNSARGFYSAWGIYDYAYPGVGEFANWDDLANLQRRGYRFADFGGSDKTLLEFKRKFGRASVYVTRAFKAAPRA